MANKEHLEIMKQGVAVWNKWRDKHPYEVPDLTRADLLGVVLPDVDLVDALLAEADLSWANLRGAKLMRADLSGTNLSGTNLTRANGMAANLSAANLRHARLEKTSLFHATLIRADLSDSSLAGTDLTGAALSGAILNKARLDYTIFGDVDLSSAMGLEKVVHLGRSILGVDTLYNSRGMIPEVFLRGVGVPEIIIQYLPSLVEQPIQFYSCFISYSHADKAFARHLHDSLQGRGIRCWLDEHQLLPGDYIHAEIDKGIRTYDKILLCCSKDSLTSWWVDEEINKTLEEERQLWSARKERVLKLIPLDLDGYLFSEEYADPKASQIRSRLAGKFTGWQRSHKKFEAQLERVVKALRADAGARGIPPKPSL